MSSYNTVNDPHSLGWHVGLHRMPFPRVRQDQPTVPAYCTKLGTYMAGVPFHLGVNLVEASRWRSSLPKLIFQGISSGRHIPCIRLSNFPILWVVHSLSQISYRTLVHTGGLDSSLFTHLPLCLAYIITKLGETCITLKILLFRGSLVQGQMQHDLDSDYVVCVIFWATAVM